MPIKNYNPMKRLMTTLILLTVFLWMESCKPYKPEGQGIAGKVTWVEGNQMPMILTDGKSSSRNTSKAIQRTLKIYPLTKLSDLKLEDGLFTGIASNPIAEVKTDENGTYTIQLSPGKYSVFTVEDGGLFANIFDGDGNVQPVTVKEGEWTLLNIQVNYKAVY
jgi:hypothetical protein